MEVRNCKQCGRLFNYIGGSYRNLCPACISQLEDRFQVVKDYIEANRYATIQMISEECEVSTRQLEQWIREERLTFAEDSPMGIPCENCGITIKSGRYCDSCKSTMTSSLNSMYKKPVQQETKKKLKADPKMRFLDKH